MHRAKEKLPRGILSVYLSLITCLDTLLASEPDAIISPFIKRVTQSAYVLYVCTPSTRLTELPFLIGGVRGRPVRAALSPLPASRRPAVLLPSGDQERSHPSAVSR